ncbi:MAG: hypothetical protein HYY67_01840 [Thaumarchaeota archaeon]|nr:hypothetical protein [Nitrososphaerota archaeon]
MYQTRLAPETERELNTEYNKLKNEAHQKAREVIIRCAFILEELGHPAIGIAAKLTEDLPYHRATVYKVLPEKYKREYQLSLRRQLEPATLESPLLAAIHSVVKTADLLKEVCNNLLRKLMADKEKLTGLQQKVSANLIKEVQETDAEIQKGLAEIAELEDDRLVINALERTQVKMLAQTHSLRQIANHYHDLKQELHGPVSTKIISKIVKAE